MDLSKELSNLKILVQNESHTIKILEDWINTSLKTTLERHHLEIKTLKTVYESKINALETRLDQEVANRKKLNLWIKENLGAQLDAPTFTAAVEGVISIKSKKRSESVGSCDSKPASTPAKAPSSLTFKHKTSNKRRGADSSKKTPEDAEDSPWSDESDDEKSSQFSKALPLSSQSSTSASSAATSSNSGNAPSSWKFNSPTLRNPTPNPALTTRIQKLAVLESTMFGTEDVTDSTFPTSDATVKTSANRMAYYLNQQKQAANQYLAPHLYDRLQLFLKKGPNVVFAPLNESDAKKDAFSFAIKTHDRLFPICPDGLVRSQVLYLVLQGIKRKLGVSTGLELPHGARFGFDPFPLQDSANDTQQQFQHLPAPKIGKDLIAFQTAFGVDRVIRFGQDQATNQQFSFEPNKKYAAPDQSAIQKQRQHMREYFDLYYYGGFKTQGAKQTSDGRIVLIVFGSAVPIVIERLSEVNYRFHLSKITLLALPYSAERLMASDTKSEDYIAAYKLYASIFKPILEASP